MPVQYSVARSQLTKLKHIITKTVVYTSVLYIFRIELAKTTLCNLFAKHDLAYVIFHKEIIHFLDFGST